MTSWLCWNQDDVEPLGGNGGGVPVNQITLVVVMVMTVVATIIMMMSVTLVMMKRELVSSYPLNLEFMEYFHIPLTLIFTIFLSSGICQHYCRHFQRSIQFK